MQPKRGPLSGYTTSPGREMQMPHSKPPLSMQSSYRAGRSWIRFRAWYQTERN